MSTGDVLHLTKLHGLGNDFLVQVVDDVPSDERARLAGDRSEFARRVCARHHGVGADGLLTALPGERADRWTMTLHNADGGRAEMSGNGIRCFVHAVARHLGPSAPSVFTVDTDAGVRVVTVAGTPNPDAIVATVDMGTASAGPALPTVGRPTFRTVLDAATVDLGNPHLVLLVEDPDAVDVAAEGPCWEGLFPDGMNVHFVAVTGTDTITQVTWERGAGVTEACGTGATAVATTASRWGLVGDDVTVVMPGGSVRVQVGDALMLTGPSQWIADLTVAR